MHLLAVLLAAAVLQAAPGDKLFVQASALNLRAKPNARATILRQVPIRTMCSVVSLGPEGWVELECFRSRGFGKLELLDTTAPTAGRLLEASKAPGLPLSESLNLLQRAVTLGNGTEEVRRAFRDQFWNAEFDRLVRAREANDIMKSAQVVSWPEDCGRPDWCVKAALRSPFDGIWNEVRVQGSDVLHARLFEDGLLWLRSGRLDTDNRTVTIQLESLTVPDGEVLLALGAAGRMRDACRAPIDGVDGTLCGYSDNDYTNGMSCPAQASVCMQPAVGRCDECKTACASPCGDCRLKCGTQNREECVRGCLEATRSCEKLCQDKLDDAYTSCSAKEEVCSNALSEKMNRTCGAACTQVDECVSSRFKQNPGVPRGMWDKQGSQIIMSCAAQLSKSCQHWCLDKYQEH